MAHSLVDADRGTHCKIVVLALVAGLAMVAMAGRAGERGVVATPTRQHALGLMIGKVGMFAIFDPTITR